jgi:hypothetical protein
MNNRTPNMTQPCYSSKRRNLTDYNEEAQYDPISLRPAFDRVFYYDNEVPRMWSDAVCKGKTDSEHPLMEHRIILAP